MPSLSAARLDTDRLCQQHPIAELVERYGIELRRSGSSFTGRCPFHLDRGCPNLTVFPRSGRFICFRCGARGDAIAFVQQIEDLSFRDAVTRLDGSVVSQRVNARRCKPTGALRRAAPPRPDPECSAVLTAAVDLYRNRLLHDPAPLGTSRHAALNAILLSKRVSVSPSATSSFHISIGAVSPSERPEKPD